jgi:hypothetical protein
VAPTESAVLVPCAGTTWWLAPEPDRPFRAMTGGLAGLPGPLALTAVSSTTSSRT